MRDRGKSIGVMGKINVGLSFLMPFVCLQILFNCPLYGDLLTTGDFHVFSAAWALLIMACSAAVGIANAQGYYRKKFRNPATPPSGPGG